MCLRPFECIGELLSASSRFFDRLCQEENAALKHSQADLEYKLSQARFPPRTPWTAHAARWFCPSLHYPLL